LAIFGTFSLKKKDFVMATPHTRLHQRSSAVGFKLAEGLNILLCIPHGDIGTLTMGLRPYPHPLPPLKTEEFVIKNGFF
jgi:hypothetical protein